MPDEDAELETLSRENHDVWYYELEERVRVWYYELAFIPFDRILAIDDLGDAFNEGPHLLVDYRDSNDPFEPEIVKLIQLDGNHYRRVDGLKRSTYLQKLRKKVQKDRDTLTNDERQVAVIKEMKKIRTQFLKATAQHISKWYEASTSQYVETNSEHSQKLGVEKLSELKKEMKKLQQQSLQMTKNLMGADSLWWDINRGEQTYSFYGNRAPEELDDVFRVIAGKLGSILMNFNFFESGEMWNTQPNRYNHSTTAQQRYPYSIDWSSDMRRIIGKYEVLQRKAQRLEPNEFEAAAPKQKNKAKRLWEKA